MKSSFRTLVYFLATVLITAFITAAVAIKLTRAQREDEVILSADEYSRLSELLVFDELADVIISDAYAKAPDKEALFAAAARGMVSALDDQYAAYYTAEEYEKYLSNINGEYTGIGILLGYPDQEGALILDVYDDTPASKAGLMTGDMITAVDGERVGGMLLGEVAALINREVGESVTLTIKRDGNETDVSLVSATINIKHVKSYLFNERTGYIRISMFTGNCAAEFDEAIKDLTDRGMKSLVIDLRNNPGGSLDDVVSIADTLLGECTIVSVRGRLEAEGDVYRSNNKKVSVPMALIVNENSASASEILAAAVQDNGAGIIVGTTTYGKGIVQTTMQLEANRAWVKLTTDAYYTPSDRNIDGVGVTPDIEVDLPENMKSTAISELEQSDDAQLWAALDYVRAEAKARQ